VIRARDVLRSAIRDHRRTLLAASALLVAHQAGEALVPVVIGFVIDAAVTTGSPGALLGGLALLGVVFAGLSTSYRFGAVGGQQRGEPVRPLGGGRLPQVHLGPRQLRARGDALNEPPVGERDEPGAQLRVPVEQALRGAAQRGGVHRAVELEHLLQQGRVLALGVAPRGEPGSPP
jgi:hypothetical protein